ncbi:hypothetical protein [Acholeplasma laidlawii]|uniref:hypothetical protein n=1 Tax=Acholeplasma laidlawii TaxID=2148 RepID=UPI0025400DAA|nr:hypothetical protein QOL21_02075 [Acholeplasma laidlawii]
MMKKLYKWDLIHYFNQLKWVFLGTLFVTALAAIFKTFSDTNIILGSLYNTAFIMSIAGIIIGLVYSFFAIFQRYYNTILKDEAYFTHTLPISKGKILLSKVLSGFSLFLIAILVAAALLIWIDVINLKELFSLQSIDQGLFWMTILSISSMVIMFFVFIVVIYAALTFGFSYNKREWLYVFVYFILYYMANQFLSLINFGINLLINPNLLDVENTEVFTALSGILIVQLIFSIGLGVLNFYIARALMIKKLNLKNG